MIPDYAIYFIIMLVLSCVFEEKIIPQMAIVALAMITITVSGISSNPQTAYPIILYVINIIYAVVCIIPKEKNSKEEI